MISLQWTLPEELFSESPGGIPMTTIRIECAQCGSDEYQVLDAQTGLVMCPYCRSQWIVPALVPSAPIPQYVVIQAQQQYQAPQPQPQYQMPQPPMISAKNWWAALFLCFFLGVFGVHRLYVGKIGTGIIWFFTLGLFGIGWLVDFIMILLSKFKDSKGYPIRLPS